MFKEELKLYKQGYKRIVGLDEAGRGCLAGPVVAAAVMFTNYKLQIPNYKQIPNSKFQTLNLKKIKDSKKLSAKKREEWYKILTIHPAIKWTVAEVSEKVIDRINILQATKLAMIKALRKLDTKPDFILVDGNFKLDVKACFEYKKLRLKPGVQRWPIKQKSVIKADEKIFSCSAASILAKVWRDRLMEKYHKKYPQYGFDKHKGYGTKMHFEALKKYGPSKIHRKSFRPIKSSC